MPNQLISDPIPIRLSSSQLNEAYRSSEEGKLIIPTVIQRANAKNQNGRIYPKEVMEKEIARYVAEFVVKKKAYGELDHTNEGEVKLKNACINMAKIWWEGNDVWGNVQILNTPSGKIVQELLKDGLTIGISSRGNGSITQINEDTVEVNDDFIIFCWDIVSNPSTEGADFSLKSMNESVNVKPGVSPIDELVSDILCLNTGFCECQLK